MMVKPYIENAPGLIWRGPRGTGEGEWWIAVWQARTDLKLRGYAPKEARLWAGANPTEDERAAIAAACNKQQDHMLTWGRGGVPGHDFRESARSIKVETSGFIYFIDAAGEAIKIGWSGAPVSRLRDLQAAHYRQLVLIGSVVGSVVEEQALHKKFGHLHLRGEWFRNDPELVAFIGEFCEQRRKSA